MNTNFNNNLNLNDIKKNEGQILKPFLSIPTEVVNLFDDGYSSDDSSKSNHKKSKKAQHNISRTRQSLRKSSKKIAEDKQKITEKDGSLREQANELNELREKLFSEENKLMKRWDELKAQEEKISAREKALTESEQKISADRDRLLKLEADNQQLLQTVNLHKIDLDALRKVSTQQKEEIAKLTKQQSSLEIENRKLHADLSKAIGQKAKYRENETSLKLIITKLQQTIANSQPKKKYLAKKPAVVTNFFASNLPKDNELQLLKNQLQEKSKSADNFKATDADTKNMQLESPQLKAQNTDLDKSKNAAKLDAVADQVLIRQNLSSFGLLQDQGSSPEMRCQTFSSSDDPIYTAPSAQINGNSHS